MIIDMRIVSRKVYGYYTWQEKSTCLHEYHVLLVRLLYSSLEKMDIWIRNQGCLSTFYFRYAAFWASKPTWLSFNNKDRTVAQYYLNRQEKRNDQKSTDIHVDSQVCS